MCASDTEERKAFCAIIIFLHHTERCQVNRVRVRGRELSAFEEAMMNLRFEFTSSSGNSKSIKIAKKNKSRSIEFDSARVVNTSFKLMPNIASP
jgi:hypothetical protein